MVTALNLYLYISRRLTLEPRNSAFMPDNLVRIDNRSSGYTLGFPMYKVGCRPRIFGGSDNRKRKVEPLTTYERLHTLSQPQSNLLHAHCYRSRIADYETPLALTNILLACYATVGTLTSALRLHLMLFGRQSVPGQYYYFSWFDHI